MTRSFTVANRCKSSGEKLQWKFLFVLSFCSSYLHNIYLIKKTKPVSFAASTLLCRWLKRSCFHVRKSLVATGKAKTSSLQIVLVTGQEIQPENWNLWEHLFGTFACSMTVQSSSNRNRKNSLKRPFTFWLRVQSQRACLPQTKKTNRANTSPLSRYITPCQLGCYHFIDLLEKTSWGIETAIILCSFNKIYHVSRWIFH